MGHCHWRSHHCQWFARWSIVSRSLFQGGSSRFCSYLVSYRAEVIRAQSSGRRRHRRLACYKDPASPIARGIFSQVVLLARTADPVTSLWPCPFPMLRTFAQVGRPEYFVWRCLASAEVVRRAAAASVYSSHHRNPKNESGA